MNHMRKKISMLIKPASAACNLRCAYCFYFDVADHRSHATFPTMSVQLAHKLIDDALSLAPDAEVHFSFQGGEPLLAGYTYFKDFFAYVDSRREEQLISYAIQTNGTLLTDELAQLFAAHDVLVGLSMDGSKSVHNTLRKDAQGKPSFERVLRAYRLLQQYKVKTNILCVVTPQLIHHMAELYQLIETLDLDYIQFIPCLAPLDAKTPEESAYGLSPQQFFTFYQHFFDWWYAKCQQGQYLSVGLFEDIMLMTQHKRPFACGMLGTCAPHLVIEADGSVYPCDFYALDTWKLGNISDESLLDIARSPKVNEFLHEPKRRSSACESCPFISMCHANCKRQNVAYFDDKGYCGYQELLRYTLPQLKQIAEALHL